MTDYDELFKEIERAKRSNPDLDLLSLIYKVTDSVFPSRNITGGPFGKERKKAQYMLSDSDILSALRKYNRNRKDDFYNHEYSSAELGFITKGEE